MKIAYITTQLPAAASGFGQRTEAIIARLEQKGAVSIYHLATDGVLSTSPQRRLVNRIEVVTGSLPQRLADVVRGKPPVWTAQISPGSAFPDLSQYDLVWFSRLRTWMLAGSPSGKNIVIDFDDLPDELFRTQRALRPRSVSGFAAALSDIVNQRALLEARRQAASAVREVFVCSQRDADIVGSANCRVIPNGTAVGNAQIDQSTATDVIFVGPMQYRPNRDAADRFEQVAALLTASTNNSFRIYGSGTKERYRASTAVQGLGRVDSLEEIYDCAAVALLPIRAGAGTRIKVLEAMAWGVPVVATPFAVAGLGVVDGVTAVLREDDRGLADAVASLLQDRVARKELAQRAFDHVIKNGSWEHALKAVDEVVSSL